MMIDRINPLDPIQPGKKAGRSGQITPGSGADSIALSPEAREKAEIYQALEIASAASGLRADRIAELREKINDPDYINDAIIKATADKIMDVFGL
jgi:negative regulator of flagellin synthesis FlgM